ncbi:MAG: cytochrome c oxidase subunit I [Chloroflexota bacterium]|nr:cytochrome c oxidase subunit I [Chloroflexota bacterium]MCH2675389.1 cytochrome c oxidase subunit I [Dehalococcoidia bacterium]MQF67321.1 cytochrome c oxidase subunit I [SAR202 cluster bacterium AD-802-F09_MRT_200m]PKB62594.1 MAG: cytochrome c oxidase subunit I [SAR202 cluster bacterium Ae2-Chloro-G3]MEC8909809.1 cytochrome c oxidase subunit I [Chloroflexota bacterium]|tara:strand:+ start:6278 stop:8116 length:1839 start_codon:yes stop_codon:yes gene_type:complete
MAAITSVIPRPTSYAGLWGWMTTVDHKRIGVLYGVTAFIFLLFAGIEAGVIRMQLASADNDLIGPGRFNEMFTMHATTMVFMVIMPMSVSFFNIVIPLAIGARDVAFPRLNALSYWIFLFGGVLMHMSFVVDQVPDAGWFSYANLTEKPFSVDHGLDYWAISLLVMGTSSVAGALNFIVTIINLRAPGMTMMRMPVFVWMTLITSLLLVLAFPVITVGLIELTMDRNFGTHFFIPAEGGDPVLWQHLFWVFGHPEVYILILPAMGIVSEILPTFSRKPLFGYPFIVFSGIVIGIMGWAVWSHHMFTVGLGPVANSVFTITTMLIAVPTGVKIFNWIGTLWKGSIEFTTAMMYALAFIALFIVGGLSGVSHAVSPSDFQQQDTYYIVAHLHYVLFGGSIVGIFAGTYYWFPKITGKMLDETLGKLNFWFVFIGMNLTFFPMHFVGMNGMPRRIYTYSAEFGWEHMNQISSVGYIVLAIGILIFMYNVWQSRNSRRVSHDPWDAPGVEWTISSPPPPYNFAEIPQIQGRDHYWIVKENAEAAGTPIREPEAHVDPSSIHMPSPSYWPIFIAAGVALIGGGLLSHYALSFVGGIIAFIGTIGWGNEPPAAPSDHH